MDSYKVFTELLRNNDLICQYHRDMKILKKGASNSKRFRVYGIFKTLQFDDDKGGPPNTTIF